MSTKKTLLNHPDISFIDNIPYTTQFDDVYFSKLDGLAESRYVFLQHNQLKERWSALNPSTSGSFIIAETGFGTGLNFLACWHLWQQVAPKRWELYFLSVEKYPLSRKQFKNSLTALAQLVGFDDLTKLSKNLFTSYPYQDLGLHSLAFDNVKLQLFIGDIEDALQQWLPSHPHSHQEQGAYKVDAWILDGFAPAKNPDMWSDHVFQYMHILSKVGSTFATFSAAGDVRRGLQNAGFKVKKAKGFGRKREMLYGCLEHYNSNTSWYSAPLENNWYYPTGQNYQSKYNKGHKNKSALIIGAGLAGCHSAYELANTGWKVTLVEQQESVAGTNSGNRQSILYTRLAAPSDRLTAFNLSALQYSLSHFKKLFASGHLKNNKHGNLCGVLQLAYSEKEQQRLENIAQAFSSDTEFCQYLNAEQASQVAGTKIEHAALFFPHAGWINPASYCQQLIDHENINFIASTTINGLYFADGQWHASCESYLDQQTTKETNNDLRKLSADITVICNSQHAQQFSSCENFKIKTIRGQVSHFAASEVSSQLKSVICHRGYIAPAYKAHHDVGATFTLKNHSPDVITQDHIENWQTLNKNLPQIAQHLRLDKNNKKPQGRTGFRCTSNDYLPIAGQVLDVEKTLTQFSALTKNAHKIIAAKNVSQSGLFVNIAHGSRGLSSAPFCAAHIASLANNTPSCMSQSMHIDVHPGRFLIRDLKRNKI